MAFRSVTTPVRADLVPKAAGRDFSVIVGPFRDVQGSPRLLIGKYEVNRLQFAAVGAYANGSECPTPKPPDTRLAVSTIGWQEAMTFGDDWTGWLLAQAQGMSDCTDGARPCLPRAETGPAMVRLPTEIEWEYAARGGLSVAPEVFAQSRYPMPDGIARHAWSKDNANGQVHPIGTRASGPLGLHDVYGNVSEMSMDRALGRTRLGQAPVFVVRGGGRYDSPEALSADRRYEVPIHDENGRVRTTDTGFRVVVAVGLGEGVPETDSLREDWPSARDVSGGLLTGVHGPAGWLAMLLVGFSAAFGAAVGVLVTTRVQGTFGKRHHCRDSVVLDAAQQQVKVEQQSNPEREAKPHPQVKEDWQAEPQRQSNAEVERHAQAEAERQAEVEQAKRQAEAEQAKRQAEAEQAKRQAAAEQAKRQSEAEGLSPRLRQAEAEQAKWQVPPSVRRTVLPNLIELSGGTFWMGSPESEKERSSDEGPLHQVTIRPFAIGKTAVTFAQYDAFVQATGRRMPDDNGWGREDRPVINVSWLDATAFANWLSGKTGLVHRLPTESEWEYATRAGTKTPFWTGDCIDTCTANYNGNYGYGGCMLITNFPGKTVPVEGLPPNPWGLHEVAGNIWEWVEDCWHENYRGAPTDGEPWLESGVGESARRVLRGGAWISHPKNLRSAKRYWSIANAGSQFVGFRLARTL